MPARRFPPPWIIDENPESFVVRDANGQALGYFYFEDEPSRRSAANLLITDEARRIVGDFANCQAFCDRRDAGPTHPGPGPTTKSRKVALVPRTTSCRQAAPPNR